jgi:DNA processing protein
LIAADLSPKIVDNFVRLRANISLEDIWKRLKTRHIRVLTWEDDGYPTRLLEIDNAPPVFLCTKTNKTDDELAVAIVGTCRMMPYGQQVTEQIAAMLANSSITVISGLALGVNTIGHRSSLNAGGRTLAVLGSGVLIVCIHLKIADLQVK